MQDVGGDMDIKFLAPCLLPVDTGIPSQFWGKNIQREKENVKQAILNKVLRSYGKNRYPENC